MATKAHNDLANKHKDLKRLETLRNNYGMLFYDPYGKQLDFHNSGKQYRERLLMAGNKLGKTYAAGFETAFHLTGLYPANWDGFVCPKQNRGWAGSVTSELTRDGMQRVLMGNIGRWGTGCIPKELILDVKRARGVPDAIETVLIKHTSGEPSQVTFKAYSDGREAWQAEDLDWVWFDEEPPADIYVEGVTRTNNTCGPVYLTFTPLLGMSEVVLRFRNHLDHPDRKVVTMTIDDVQHYSPEQRAKIIASYPAHEREARANGVPMLGSGRIFPVPESTFSETCIARVPPHWKQLLALDFGWDHPTAAVHLLYDEDADCIHVRRCYRQKEATPIVHAAAIRPWGDWIPVAWPQDGYQHDKGNGEALAHQYKKQGIAMLSEHAKYPDDRGNSVEAGLMEMLDRMSTGRLKVDENLSQWFEEYRMYHRKDGKVIKEYDDILCATRYGVMMIRYAKPLSYAPAAVDRYATHANREGGTTWMAS